MDGNIHNALLFSRNILLLYKDTGIDIQYSFRDFTFMFFDQMLDRVKVVMPCANDKVRTLKASIFRLGCSVCYVRPGLISSADPPSERTAEDRHHPGQVRQSSDQILAWLYFNESILGSC